MTPLPNLYRKVSPQIAGYTVIEPLYQGFRTTVYRAMQTAEQRPVVIKLLRREYPSFSELVQLRNQYTITKSLAIPGVVQPLSLETVGSSYALVMEDWGGTSLSNYVQQQRLALTEVLAIALQLADILHDLAHHRVVHKDIKPANILIHPESKQVKLTDFSIASLLPKEAREIQSPNILEGTLAYLAPEQTGRMNRGIDYRADFYALGVTLYQLLTGALPFKSDDPLELIHCHIAKVPLSIDQVNPDIPQMVSAIVDKLMAKNAEDRYQSPLGLKHDLEECLTQWQATGSVQDFELGQWDASDRFLIPEKLYGRQMEVTSLLRAFDRVAKGSSELVLLAGFSGIGKTAVVNEVHKPIVRQRGYFIKGKFDQFNRNIPLSAFVQALRDLMGQLLAESDAQLQTWKTKILQAVGENGQVLIEVIPTLEQIIGKQPQVAELPGSAAQNRFNLLFQKFIEVLTTVEHPLVIFLDDLQWADSASLQLIKLLMHDNGYLLMLGAYRDNEVSAVHPFSVMMDELKKTQIAVQTITLAPLQLEDTNHLVADTLNCSTHLARPLTELINRRTKGNPFFTTQFLKGLYEDGYIRFDRDRRYWECDMAQVSTLALTDDVMEFMVLQLQKLPAPTQRILKLAACIGNQFDLKTLTIVSEQSLTETATALWKALQEGLILPQSDLYKFFQNTELSDVQSDINPKYRFLHDRVQQAAYSLIPEAEKQATHLRIGRLLQHLAIEPDYLFQVLNHLNMAASLMTEKAERGSLLVLNLLGCQRAKAAIAYEAAVLYASKAINLLPADSWSDDYTLALKLYGTAAEVAYLNTEFDQAEQLIHVVLRESNNLIDCIKVYELLVQIYIAKDQQLTAIETGLEILPKLGVPLVSQTNWQANLPPLPNEQTLASKPRLINLAHLAALRLLITITPPTHHVKPELFPAVVLTMVTLCDREGLSSLAAYVYGIYGLLLCALVGDPERAHRSGQLSLTLLEKYQARELRTKVNMLFAVFVCAAKEPGNATLPLLNQGIEAGFETGDIEYVSYCIMAYFSHLFLLGQPLQKIDEARKRYIPTLVKFKQEHCIEYSKLWLQAAQRFIGSIDSDSQLENELATLQHFEATHNHQCLFAFHLEGLISNYIFESYPQALDHAVKALKSQDAAFGILLTAAHNFYYSLTLLASLKTVQETVQQATIFKQVTENQAKLQQLSGHAPNNYLHKFDLVAAERARVLGQKSEAIDAYDRAIVGANENNYVQEEALANELAAKFYLDWGKEKVAQEYLADAYYAYARWGAKAKVQDLEHRYPHLLMLIGQQQRMASSATDETGFATNSPAALQPLETQRAILGSNSVSTRLDRETVLKASQAVSSEIQLDKLLAKLLYTVLENAGADKAALLMSQANHWFIEAVATVNQPAQVQSVALSDSSEIAHPIVNSVKRTLQPVVIVDATTHADLVADIYVMQQQPKSILCTPILQQGKLVAILYLENHVTAGAFTHDRVELLNFLCTQAAISLENARLYQQAQTYARQLEQSQLQIVQSEKMASLGNLVAGVAHEINNPVGFLNGGIHHARDYARDLLAHLNVYQQHADAVPPVQTHAKAIDLEFLIEDLPKLLDSMTGATERIQSISNSLRTFSRADTEEKVSADLQKGLDSTLLILKYRLKANKYRPAIGVIRNYSELPLVRCFPGQLNQVFMNVLANAIDMFDDIAHRTDLADLEANPPQIVIQTTPLESATVEVRIRDNGRGMSEAIRAKVFDHLFTTKGIGKGTGLGLAIARQIVVEKHGGSLSVQSEPGQGSEFCIQLPIYAE